MCEVETKIFADVLVKAFSTLGDAEVLSYLFSMPVMRVLRTSRSSLLVLLLLFPISNFPGQIVVLIFSSKPSCGSI
jgi:hypothetical protein